jgi:hypothetical protein
MLEHALVGQFRINLVHVCLGAQFKDVVLSIIKPSPAMRFGVRLSREEISNHSGGYCHHRTSDGGQSKAGSCDIRMVDCCNWVRLRAIVDRCLVSNVEEIHEG